MKKILLFLFILILVAGAFLAWQFFGSTVRPTKDGYLYIPTGSGYNDVINRLQEEDILSTARYFHMLAKYRGYHKSVRPGRYKLEEGMSVFTLLTKLRNGVQEPVNLVITRLRTKESLASRVDDKFEFDSTQMIAFLTNMDTLRSYGLDTQTVMAVVMPNTYTYYWNSTPSRVFSKFWDEHQRFWNKERKAKADSLGLSPIQVITLASIVEEETNYNPEKPVMASVYLNRLKINMPLQADPTVKFAMRDFGLKRLYEKHLLTPSPYNTYRNTGLPPGPINTPSVASIEAVLNPAQTDYLYFVAKSDFSGAHTFAASYEDHLKNRRAYQQAQDKQDSIRKAKLEAGPSSTNAP